MNVSRHRKNKSKSVCNIDEFVPNEICLGKYYMVKRRDNSWLPGEVVSKRTNKKTKNVEYYVNYLSLDRRLDEWVRGYRIKNNDYKGNLETSSLLTQNTASDSENSLDLESDQLEREHRELTKVKMIKSIQFGNLEINTWYYSPYPNIFGDLSKLFVCRMCFKYMVQENSYYCHSLVCEVSQPPGRMVYHKDKLAIFEVDGLNSLIYCQNLSLLGKLFIDHKTLCYDIESFLFYVLCSKEDKYYIIRGYFSKEKENLDGYNLSCIMILPPFQKQGFGKLLIDFSYKLSIIEGVPGSPEDPISDLGLFTYKSYWTWAILIIFKNCKSSITIDEISIKTGISKGDIIYTLESLKLLGYWKGSRDVFIKMEIIESIVESDKFKKPKLTIDDSLIKSKLLVRHIV